MKSSKRELTALRRGRAEELADAKLRKITEKEDIAARRRASVAGKDAQRLKTVDSLPASWSEQKLQSVTTAKLIPPNPARQGPNRPLDHIPLPIFFLGAALHRHRNLPREPSKLNLFQQFFNEEMVIGSLNFMF